MSYGRTLIYCYDGTFDGLMCCVFNCFAEREIPSEIAVGIPEQLSFADIRQIATDPAKARRVISAIPKKISPNVLDLVRKMFLSCERDKDMTILLYLCKGFRVGAKIENMLTDSDVNKLNKAVLHCTREAHLLEGFVRFSDLGDCLAAVIEPKNTVLPLIADHFADRFRNENFLIYDKTHRMALIYYRHTAEIAENIDFELPPASAPEIRFRELWRTFYNAIGIEERYNPKCRMSFMPKRFWGCMTEMCGEYDERPADAFLPDAGVTIPSARK